MTPSKNPLPRPTQAELAILRVLWDRGPSSVREVHEAIHAGRDTGYTTVLKTLQIMTAKGLVVRDDTQRTHVYRAAAEQSDTQRQLVAELLDRAFGGSAAQLILHALETRRASREEMIEIRRMLDRAEGKKP
jgi:predicted transcriptional regulator